MAEFRVNLSDIVATALEYGLGIWFVGWGLLSVCAPTHISEESLMYETLAWYTKRAIGRQSTKHPLTTSQIRFWGITYLVGGILFLTDATMRSFFSAPRQFVCPVPGE